MKILLTGGAGFIGSHLAEALLNHGDEVCVVDDLSSGSMENISHLQGRKGFSFEKMDIRSEAVGELIRTGDFDLVNHHAAQKSVTASMEDPIHDAEINTIGLLNLLQSMTSSRCRKLIFASSGGAIYGDQLRFPAAEDHPISPLSPYGISKYSSELYLKSLGARWQMQSVALRYSNVFGPRQDAQGEAGVCAIFGGRLRDGEPVDIFGDGEQTRDFVFVRDVVAANLSSIRWLNGPAQNTFEAFNISTGQETSINEVLAVLSRISNRRTEVKKHPARRGEVLRSALDGRRAFEAMGWKAQIRLEDGLKETFEWINARS